MNAITFGVQQNDTENVEFRGGKVSSPRAIRVHSILIMILITVAWQS